jgi:hypothetical protein
MASIYDVAEGALKIRDSCGFHSPRGATAIA